MNPVFVLFAIEAGVKLGRKVNEVLIDQTAERPLLLPLGELFGNVQEGEATQFFLRPENVHLIKEGGPYFGFDKAQRRAAYRTLLAIESSLPVGTDRAEIVTQLTAFEQLKSGFGAHHPLRRILGTVIELGIDFVVAHPEALGKNSAVRRLVHAFVSSLDETDFAEGANVQVIGDLFSSTLRVLGENASLVDDEARVQGLIGGVITALVADINQLTTNAEQVTREHLFQRLGGSILRGGAAAFTEHIDLFLPRNSQGNHNQVRTLVQATLTQVLAGIQGKEDLFTNEAVELIIQSALRTVAENVEVFSHNNVLQALISHLATVLTDTRWQELFSSKTMAEEVMAAVLHAALEMAREHMGTLLTPEHSQEHLLATALEAMAASLSTSLAGSGKVQNLLSKKQLVELTRVVLGEIAQHPEQLLGSKPDDVQKTVLAQVLASVARALGEEPKRWLTGAGVIELVRLALHEVIRNRDKLIDTGSASPETNVLFQVLRQVVVALDLHGAARPLVYRDAFLDIARRVLPLVSANLEVLLREEAKVVQETVVKALALAQGPLEQRINGTNLPILIAYLLRQVLWDELNLEDSDTVERSARLILKTA